MRSRVPVALARRSKVLVDGLTFPRSSLAIADWVVFIFLANCSWVSPPLIRASIMARANSYSGPSFSYSILYFEFLLHFLCRSLILLILISPLRSPWLTALYFTAEGAELRREKHVCLSPRRHLQMGAQTGFFIIQQLRLQIIWGNSSHLFTLNFRRPVYIND